jgi:poly(3-hydroxyoctanoate) depolymerase
MADEHSERFISVDRLRLRFLIRHGDPGRTPLLICNGIGASLELLEPLLMALGDHPFIAFDAPGTGESSTPNYPPTLDGIADTVVRALDELGVPVVDALGASWGGALAQVLARRHPQRIRRLVLASTGAGAAVVPGRPRAVAALLTPWRYSSQAHLTRIAPILYGPEIREDPHFIDQQRELRFTTPPSMRGYVWQMLALRGFASVLWLGRLSQPTLVMHGSADPIVPAVNARILATRIPNARLAIIEGGGHLFMLTRAQEIAGLLREFLWSDGQRVMNSTG